MGFLKNRLVGLAPENRLLSRLFQRNHGNTLFGYYHVVSNEPVPHTDSIISRISIESFTQGLEVLLRHFQPLDFADFLKGNRPKAPSIMVTFDDGYKEMHDIVAPILLKKGVPAAFFINSSLAENKKFLHRHKVSILIHHLNEGVDDRTVEMGFSEFLNVQITNRQQAITYLLGLDSDVPGLNGFSEALGIDFQEYLKVRKPFMTLYEMRKLVAQGFYFGGHGVNHADYSKIGLDEQFSETFESIDYVQNGLGLSYRIFAFPYTDRPVSSSTINSMFDSTNGMRPDFLFGNSGLKTDVHPRMVQRVSFERPNIGPIKATNIEILHGLISGYRISRR